MYVCIYIYIWGGLSTPPVSLLYTIFKVTLELCFHPTFAHVRCVADVITFRRLLPTTNRI